MPYVVTAILFCALPVAVAVAKQPKARLSVLQDYNVVCMGLLTLPLIVVLLLTERSLIPHRIEKVQKSGILNPKRGVDLQEKWETLFRRVNIVAQLVGIGVGIAVAYTNYYGWIHETQTTRWLVIENGRITSTGWVLLLWLLPVFYFVCTVYVVRGITITLMLRSIVLHSDVRPQPFHGDNAGGLSPIARIGLRNQYVLAVAGVNIVCLIVVARRLIQAAPEHPSYLVGLVVAAGVFYLVAAPVVFVCPLLPFRKSMREEKARLLDGIGQGVTAKVNEIVDHLSMRAPTTEDEQALERLANLRDLVARCPVWPFDTLTLKRFLTAYLAPLATALATLPPIADAVSGFLLNLLKIKR